MFGTLGPMISPIIGGVLIDTLGWRSVFGFALIAGGAITLSAYLVMYETHPVANRTEGGDERARRATSRCSAGCASSPSCCRAASTPAPSW